jgi:hypothetical protein
MESTSCSILRKFSWHSQVHSDCADGHRPLRITPGDQQLANDPVTLPAFAAPAEYLNRNKQQ